MAWVSDQHGVAKNVVLWRGESLTILTDKMVFGRRTLVLAGPGFKLKIFNGFRGKGMIKNASTGSIPSL